jgi:hypothetical protein
MRTRLAGVLVAASVFWLASGGARVRAQTTSSRSGQNIITKFRIQPKSGGVLFVTIDGKERKIVKEANEAWIIEGGRKLAYTTSEAPGEMGAGGTLIVFDARTNQHKKLATSEDDLVGLKEARSGDGKTVLLLETSNAEVCAPTVWVIDPARGEVFSETPAQVLSIKADLMLLGYFKEAEWGKNCESKKMKPYKTKSFSLSALLKRPVITTRPSQ